MFQSTPKQQAASRANAQKSTGPRTTAGKAASRFNALKHGIYAVHQIMFDEKPEDLAELSAEYHELCSPADAKQRLLVDTLVHSEWRLRRMRRVEAELWQTAHNAFIVENIDRTSTCTSGDAFATGSATFECLQRVANCCERVYHRALHELERLQEEVARGHALRTPQPRLPQPPNRLPPRHLPARTPPRTPPKPNHPPHTATQSRRKPHEDALLRRCQTHLPSAQFSGAAIPPPPFDPGRRM